MAALNSLAGVSPVRIALLGVLVASALRAQPVAFTSPRAGQALQAGQVVEVRFDGVPADVEEVELLLVAGRDRQFVLRLTESLEPNEGSVLLWTVPNLELPEARLLLRMGLGGREIESAPSEPFSVESSRSCALVQLQARRGEVWIDAAGQEEIRRESLPSSALGARGASFERPALDTSPALPSSGRGVSCSVSASAPAAGRTVAAVRPPEPASLSRAPRCVPQRI